MRLRPTLAALAVLALASPLLPSASAAPDPGTGTASLTAVANLPYKAVKGSDGEAPNRGTDIEFATIKGKRYALAGSYHNGLQIVDVSAPTKPRLAGRYDCGVEQGDVQVFTRGGRTYVGYTKDDGYVLNRDTACVREAVDLGFRVPPTGDGVFLADITDVRKPRTVSFVPFVKGAHNHSIHPSGGFIYNSNSDLITNLPQNEIEIVDIRDFRNPRPLPALDLPPVPTSLGADSHDITFSADGKRAYSAALSQTVVIDTTKPAAPRVISTIVDPTINVVHQADPVRITDPVLGARDFLIIEDEFAGALGTGQCPNGGVHVYDVTGTREARPVKVGYWNIAEVRPTSDSPIGRCTAHVFDLHEKAGVMTIAYYNGGVRVVDIRGLVGVALGGSGVGMKEIGSRRFADSDTWAAKTPAVAKDGSFFLYGNDQNRGLDVYRFDPRKVSAARGTDVWMGAAEAARALASRSRLDLTGYRMLCLPQKAAQAAHHR